MSNEPNQRTRVMEELRWRGLAHQSTDEKAMTEWLAGGVRSVYAGFDPTADSLHVGHMMAVMILRRFQQSGHRPIAVVGGATGMIGDPSGKTDERQLLSLDAIRHNQNMLREQLSRFLDFNAGDASALVVNNYDWIGPFSFLDFLRDVGKHFPVNVMLAKDSVRSRLERENGLSYTEFSYMLLQAFDFAHLWKTHECGLQVGGSDQWGNITAGIDLARRLHGASLHGMTCPLLLRSDGGKMGKTEKGALWLDPKRTTPYQFFQYWINLDDQDVEKCLRFFTDMAQAEIEELAKNASADPAKRLGQRRLAEELTKLVHGEEALRTVERATSVLFGAELGDLSEAELLDIFADVPSRELARDRLATPGLSAIDAFCEAGLTKTKSEARREIESGGAYVNNRRVPQVDAMFTTDDLAVGGVMVLRRGKKKYALLKFVV